MARRGYPPEFRRRVVDLVEGGRKVSEVAADLEVSEQTIYTWRRPPHVFFLTKCAARRLVPTRYAKVEILITLRRRHPCSYPR